MQEKLDMAIDLIGKMLNEIESIHAREEQTKKYILSLTRELEELKRRIFPLE